MRGGTNEHHDSDEVKGGVEEDPDQIDKMPVQAGDLHRVVEFPGKMALAGAPPQHGQRDHAADDMYPVETGQKIVKAVEDMGLRVDLMGEVAPIFISLVRQEP